MMSKYNVMNALCVQIVSSKLCQARHAFQNQESEHHLLIDCLAYTDIRLVFISRPFLHQSTLIVTQMHVMLPQGVCFP